MVLRDGVCLPDLDACGLSAVWTDGGCLPVGVPASGCAEGFEHDGAGGCAPVLPPERCGVGTMAIPGDASCRPIVGCKEGRWGDAPTSAGTIFVDAASTTPSPDGSLDRPWPTIQRAIDAAPVGATIAIGPGKYAETVRVNKRVALHGACPSTVEIAGATGEFASVDITQPAELHEIAVTGSGFGVVVTNAREVLLDRLWVHDTKTGGVYVANGGKGASATLVGSLVERATGAGVSSGSGELLVDRSVVRDTRADTRRDWGYGVRSELFGPPDKPLETPASVTVRRSLIEHNLTGGMLAQGSSLVLEGTVVRDVGTRPKDGLGGEGVIGLFFRLAPMVRVTQSWVGNTHTAGVVAYGGTLEVDRTSIEDVEPNSKGELGFGVLSRPSGEDPPLSAPTSSITATRVRRVRTVGILAIGGEATLVGALVLDVTPRADGAFGDGVGVGAFVAKDGTIVDATASVTRVLVRRASRAGFVIAGATVSIATSQLSCNGIDLDAESTVGGGIGHPFSLTDDGHTWCGCGLGGSCRAQSTGLEPVAAP